MTKTPENNRPNIGDVISLGASNMGSVPLYGRVVGYGPLEDVDEDTSPTLIVQPLNLKAVYTYDDYDEIDFTDTLDIRASVLNGWGSAIRETLSRKSLVVDIDIPEHT
jgi:hypothetical protein